MKIIGLTGGIGTGKSTVSQYLSQKKLVVIDADNIAREIVKSGSETLKKIVSAFGEDVILPNGDLDRRALAQIVFYDKSKKNNLDKITHSAIIKVINEEIAKCEALGERLVVIDAPLLVESGLHNICTWVWVVETDDALRINRIIKRDLTNEDDVIARINNQLEREKRNKWATDILYNNGEKEELYLQVDKLLEKICVKVR